MDNKQEQQIIEIVKLATQNSSVDKHSTNENTNGWDSLAYLIIAQEIEDFFGIIVTSKNIDLLNSIQGILTVINSGSGGMNV